MQHDGNITFIFSAPLHSTGKVYSQWDSSFPWTFIENNDIVDLLDSVTTFYRYDEDDKDSVTIIE